jgi:hypothetical protein
MANQWFKFYGAEYLSDPKMDRLTVQERSCWITLLCMASQSDGRIKFLSLEGLLNKSGVHFNPYDSTEWDNSQNVLRNFELYEMIKISKEGVIYIINWEKRQEHNLTVAERVAKHRLKKKCNKNVTSDVTSVTTEENRIEENRIDTENKINKFTQQDLELSELLLSLIQNNNPTFKKPDLDSWAEQVRLMRERDNRTYEQIEFMVKWCQKDTFWQANILSTRKLREKFDTLVAQAKRSVNVAKEKRGQVFIS